MNITLSIYHDKRRSKNTLSKNEIYPVKLRVYNKHSGKAKFFGLGIDLTEVDFQKIYSPKERQRLPEELRVIKEKLQRFEVRAQSEIDKIDRFSFDLFEKKFYRRANSGSLVMEHYNNKIKWLEDNEKIGTSDNYKSSLSSLTNYLYLNGKSIEALRFSEVDKKWLENYERHMLSLGKSKTTIGFYLRPLSSLFNIAIEQNDVPSELFPFGKKGYIIPKGQGKKKALSKPQIKLLVDSIPETPQQEKAKDFWLLSYCLNGMNMQDLITLKKENVNDNRIEFIREKTKDTNRDEQVLKAPLIPYSSKIINKYKNQSGSIYLFDIIHEEMSPVDIKRKVKGFTRFVNQHIKKIAINIGLPVDLSTYWARHSMATIGVKSRGMEFVKEALGHSNLKTTQIYFAGFEDNEVKGFAEDLMNFDNE